MDYRDTDEREKQVPMRAGVEVLLVVGGGLLTVVFAGLFLSRLLNGPTLIGG